MVSGSRGLWLPTPLLCSALVGNEAGDEADEWVPPGGERSCETQLSEREREEESRGSDNISSTRADCAPACHAAVTCHICKCGKNKRCVK
jgi:hypothetical protein